MSKITGFLITKDKVTPQIDVFNVGLTKVILEHNNYFIHLWGIGDIQNYKVKGKYSLSFPLHDDLLDRNVLIELEDESIVIENDWLGSIPIFYNLDEKIVSTNVNFCLTGDKSFDREGIINFFQFGYSVFERTPFGTVRFMRYFSFLKLTSDEIQIYYKDDPVLEKNLFDTQTTTEEVLSKVNRYVQRVEEITQGDIILPTSGGYDSRLLNWAVSDKTRIKSFTYGISRDQSKSYEVVHAKKIAEIYNTEWSQIQLSDYPRYISEWHQLYGFSTHLHGMYHIEFYKKSFAENRISADATFLSGIVGDIWAGSIDHQKLDKPEDVYLLGYTHGMKLDDSALREKDKSKLMRHFFEENMERLQVHQVQNIFTIRFKLILISYLVRLPEVFSLPVWTPFLNFDIAVSMLRLPNQLRENRSWQKQFFSEAGLDLEAMNLLKSKRNDLDFTIAKKHSFSPVDSEVFNGLVRKDKIENINSSLQNFSSRHEIKQVLLKTPIVGKLCRKMGLKNDFLKALYGYYVLKPIEMSLK